MAVIATPTSHALEQCCDNRNTEQVLTPVSCAGQSIVSAPISEQNGQPVLTRMRAISISQGQCATITWQMHDKDGLPVDLSACNSLPMKVVLRLRDQIALSNTSPVVQVDGTVTDAPTGKVEVALTQNMVGVPGIFYGEMALINIPAEEAGLPCVVFSNTFYVIINRSAFDARSQSRDGGPPSIAEIRLHLRDSAPSESYLLENLMFDDAEIALAIGRPVMYWNEIPPPIRTFTTKNFPFRYHWLEGICANLFLMVAEQFRRNQLSYSAGGIQVDDQNKEAAYERAGQARWQAYREWVRGTKASINLEGCYGEVTSNYKYSAYTDAIRIRY
jgi:hypothetical protein